MSVWWLDYEIISHLLGSVLPFISFLNDSIRAPEISALCNVSLLFLVDLGSPATVFFLSLQPGEHTDRHTNTS